MKTFLAMCIYFIVGGIFSTVCDNHYRNQCGEGLDSATVTGLALLWPAVPVILIISNAESSGDMCGQPKGFDNGR